MMLAGSIDLTPFEPALETVRLPPDDVGSPFQLQPAQSNILFGDRPQGTDDLLPHVADRSAEVDGRRVRACRLLLEK
jgi:hypothetical protein